MKTLNLFQFLSILLTVLALSVGQIGFKLAAAQTHTFREALHSLFCGWLLASLLIYALATVLWIYTLRTVPLKTAYPFVALAYFFVPLLSHFYLGEVIGMRAVLGAFIILLGVWVSVS